MPHLSPADKCGGPAGLGQTQGNVRFVQIISDRFVETTYLNHDAERRNAQLVPRIER